MSDDFKSQEFYPLQHTQRKTHKNPIPASMWSKNNTSWSYQMSQIQATISSCWFHSVIMEKHNTSVYQCHICENKNEIETTEANILVSRKPHNQTVATTLDDSTKIQ